MTTNEFIEMLRKADPKGDGHVRLPGDGVPIFGETKEGYWDGPYQYLEYTENKSPYDAVLVTTTKGYKVDIHVMDFDNIVWDCGGDL